MIDYRHMDRDGGFTNESDFHYNFSKRPNNVNEFSEVSDDAIYLIQNLQTKYQNASMQSRRLEEETNPLFYVLLAVGAFVIGKSVF